jgi:hypothetical protein
MRTTGIIREISEELGRGGGTKLYPAFLVEVADGQFEWFSPADLKPGPKDEPASRPWR